MQRPQGPGSVRLRLASRAKRILLAGSISEAAVPPARFCGFNWRTFAQMRSRDIRKIYSDDLRIERRRNRQTRRNLDCIGAHEVIEVPPKQQSKRQLASAPQDGKIVSLRLHRDFLLWSGGREAEGGGLLNRCTVEKPYRGFESLPLRQSTETAECPENKRNISASRSLWGRRKSVNKARTEKTGGCKWGCKNAFAVPYLFLHVYRLNCFSEAA